MQSHHCQILKRINDQRDLQLQKLGATRYLGVCICENGSTPHPLNLPSLPCRTAGFCTDASPSLQRIRLWHKSTQKASASSRLSPSSRRNLTSNGSSGAQPSAVDDIEHPHDGRSSSVDDARIVTVLANRRLEQVKHILRLKHGLNYVGSALSFHVLLCGVRDLDIEATFLQANISFHPMESPTLPVWAHKNHRTTFSKLLLWNASYA